MLSGDTSRWARIMIVACAVLAICATMSTSFAVVRILHSRALSVQEDRDPGSTELWRYEATSNIANLTYPFGHWVFGWIGESLRTNAEEARSRRRAIEFEKKQRIQLQQSTVEYGAITYIERPHLDMKEALNNNVWKVEFRVRNDGSAVITKITCRVIYGNGGDDTVEQATSIPPGEEKYCYIRLPNSREHPGVQANFSQVRYFTTPWGGETE